MAATQKRLILLGATGETGRQALAAALADARISTVLTLGRTAPPVPAHHKLRHESLDFEALLSEGTAGGPETAKLRDADADAVLIALGTTRANAGSAERFERIDREYVLAAARAARKEGKEQSVVYVSSKSADSSSFFPYSKSKGLTEEGLAALGYARAVIARPGVLLAPGGRGERRIPEQVAVALVPRLPFIGSSLSISTVTLGRALVNACLSTAPLGHQETLAGHPATILDNNDARALGEAA
ncbi:uncharacterized protein RHOBADRAFT_54541 [Rhodotorula graminis WP1]|uniref:NAD(P)-binding domain-containing protein n=1 Tax=Rhodotorula graminis (strain WP1) TaxID=578459 RepID=A0A0P9EJZ7_RHOGW|nr:uncharacterized protein RHOBADRAFT_54541 [Rhodotorula graminis WP1]KPV73958.1 hypothetical protein RHOBADRAFT_54541 [Rhodotorula graminis WP1]